MKVFILDFVCCMVSAISVLNEFLMNYCDFCSNFNLQRFQLWCVLRMAASLDSTVSISLVVHGFLMATLWLYPLSGTAVKFYFPSMCWGNNNCMNAFLFCLCEAFYANHNVWLLTFPSNIVEKYYVSPLPIQISHGVFLPWMGTIFLLVKSSAQFMFEGLLDWKHILHDFNLFNFMQFLAVQ